MCVYYHAFFALSSFFCVKNKNILKIIKKGEKIYINVENRIDKGAQGCYDSGMIRFYRLFDLIARRGMKKTDLLAVMSSSTLARFSKGGDVSVFVIERVCGLLNVQPGDIMEYIPDEAPPHAEGQ